MKSLLKNSLYNIFYKCSSLMFPLITMAYISRVLLKEGIGKVNSAQNIVQYFIILSTLGLPVYGTKIIAANSNNTKELNKNFNELFFINIVSCLMSTIVYYIIILNVHYFSDKILLYSIVGLAIPFNMINIDWFYQGKEEYRYILVRSLIIKTTGFILTFVLIHNQKDYILYAGLLVFSNVANYIFNIINIKNYIRITFKNLMIKRHLKSIFILFASSIAIEIYTLADTTMLTFMSGYEAVGLYSNSINIIRVVRGLITAISAVYLPRLSFFYFNKKIDEFINLIMKGIKILLFLSVPAAVGIMLTASCFIPIYFGVDFEKATITTGILSFSIITVAISNFIGYQVLITIGKEKIMFYSTVIGAIINIILNYFLIKFYSYNGAAIASVITELSVTFFQVYKMKKYITVKFKLKYLFKIIFGVFIMSISVILIRMVIDNDVIELILSILVGAIIYIGYMIVVKDEYAMFILNFFKVKLFEKNNNRYYK